MPRINPPVIDEQMQLQHTRDIAKRSVTGTFIYLVIWVAITLPSQFLQMHPKIWWPVTLLFGVMAMLRIVLIRFLDRMYATRPKTWQSAFFALVWLSALFWGVLCASSLTVPALQPLSFLIIVTTAGLTSGGAVSVAPSRPLTLGMISAFLLPSVVVLLFFPHDHDPSLCLLFIIYWLGMYSVTKTQHKEYWLSLNHAFVIKRYARELERLNGMDGLTGLKNRAFFDDSLRTELKKSSRTELPIALLLIDIDHFKAVNDRYGHLAGDECLRRISQLLMETVQRETDIVARFGGEEFAIILPGASRTQARAVAERIRQSTQKMDIVIDDLITLHLTVSIGVADVTAAIDASNEELIAAADAALYAAKARGRNLVIMADAICPPAGDPS